MPGLIFYDKKIKCCENRRFFLSPADFAPSCPLSSGWTHRSKVQGSEDRSLVIEAKKVLLAANLKCGNILSSFWWRGIAVLLLKAFVLILHGRKMITALSTRN
ncbi:hypothetical protein AVEN_189288-1 [Araneus ventricosus]|uniref:Uncharacterized protein n=1 Tax=Araneus ventricosus TaxID=182803 RepID=A0A4Y2MYJ3_ARAVE|nr:hypothetical protein AVEN_189288-1 [Araneus ventricosus]